MPRTIKEQILYIIGTFFRSQGKFKREWSTAIRLSSKPFNDGIINIHVTMMQLPDNLTYIDTRSKEYSIQSERKKNRRESPFAERRTMNKRRSRTLLEQTLS